jgi:ribonuclease BN (tRNA processing enzyme)
MEIRDEAGNIVIVDAGTGIRRLGKRLVEENRLSFALIFTHAHWDHILGFPFFRPIYLPETRIEMYGCAETRASFDSIVAKTMEAPYFPVPFGDISATIVDHSECDDSLSIGNLRINPIPLSHPNGGRGLEFIENDRRFIFLTDNELGHRHPGGLAFDEYVEACRGADLLIHDAEFTEQEYQRTRTWGHSTCDDALNLALRAGVGRFGLYHHNQERADDGIDKMVARCRAAIADRGAALECFAVHQGMEIRL